MICKPEDAKLFQCCAMPKTCEGKNCMAWKDHCAEDMSVDPPKIRGLSMPRRLVADGKGYCGLCE